MPLNVDVLVSLIAALLVEESNCVHELVDHSALLRHTSWDLKIYVLHTTDFANAAPASSLAGSDPDVVALFASVRLESDARLPVIVVHSFQN